MCPCEFEGLQLFKLHNCTEILASYCKLSCLISSKLRWIGRVCTGAKVNCKDSQNSWQMRMSVTCTLNDTSDNLDWDSWCKVVLQRNIKLVYNKILQVGFQACHTCRVQKACAPGLRCEAYCTSRYANFISHWVVWYSFLLSVDTKQKENSQWKNAPAELMHNFYFCATVGAKIYTPYGL